MLERGDVETLLNLVGELGELAHDSQAWQTHLLERLSQHLGGRIGLSGTVLAPRGNTLDTFSERMSAGRQQMITYGLNALQRETVVDSLSDMEASGDPTLPFLRKRAGSSYTMLRQQIVSDREWYSSDHVQQIRRPAGTDSFILSQCVLPEHGFHVFGIHRAWGDKPFGERERVLIEMLHQELEGRWLRSGVSGFAPAGIRLQPRLHQVLHHLCSGLSEKEIAAAMQLSQHTVHQYIKELYRRIGVRGRSELTGWLVRQMRSRPAPVW